jgi:ClpP class serine protease
LTSAHVTQTSILRDQVSFLLSEYRKMALLPTTAAAAAPAAATHGNDTSSVNATTTTTEPENDGAEMEVIVLLESPGGSASDYALAAQQILRLRREPGITVTIAVDKVAASGTLLFAGHVKNKNCHACALFSPNISSHCAPLVLHFLSLICIYILGGYMIACTSSPGRLLAAPFAVLGSIGVIGQTINVHKVLEGWGVQPLVFRGGRDKAPVGMLGEVTRQGLAKVQDMVDDTHRAFKRFVAESRPAVANRIENVATGDVWLGYDALEQGLIDRIVTSDEYIGEKMAQGARVLKLVLFKRGSFPFQRPSSTSEPVSIAATALGSSSSSSLENLGGQVVLQFAARIRSVLERFAVSFLDQQPPLPGFGGGSDGFVDLVQDNQAYMFHSKTAAKATATVTPFSSCPSL